MEKKRLLAESQAFHNQFQVAEKGQHIAELQRMHRERVSHTPSNYPTQVRQSVVPGPGQIQF